MNKPPLFELISAHIIKSLYAGFPITETFSIIKVGRVLKPELTDEMQFINTASATFNWLHEKDYIVIGSQDLNDYYDVSLSEKCLAAFITNKRSDEQSITDGLLGDATQQVDAIERLILIKSAI
jgi:hypothetical protein